MNTPLHPPPKAAKPPFAIAAAQASWIAPLVCILLTILLASAAGPAGRDDAADPMVRTGKFIQGIISLAIILGGFVLSIVALAQHRLAPKSKILVPALIGFLLNVFFLFTMIYGIVLISKLR